MGDRERGETTDGELARLRDEVAALRARNALLESVIEVIDDIVFAKDRDGRYLLINGAAARRPGRSVDEIVGRSDAELLPPETARRIAEDERDLMARGTTRTYEEQVVLEDGARTFVTTKGARRDERGEVVGVVGIARDVTERKRAEEALRGTREFLGRLLDHAPAAIYATSLDGRRILVNRAWEDFWRRPREEVVGRPLEEVLPLDVAQLSLRENRAVVEAGATLAFEEDIVTPDGIRTLYSVKFPLHDAEGRIEAVVGFSIDISERKRVERSLRLGEERLRGAFEHAAVGMAVADAGGRVLQANRAFCALTGYSERELLARDVLSITHEEDRATYRALIERLRAGEIPSFVVEKRYLTRSGGVAWARNSVSLVPDDAGERRHLIALSQDIGEQRRAEAGQRRLLQELEAERGRLAEVFRRSPAYMAVLRGPEHVFERVNDMYLELVGPRELIGRPVREALPELEGQGYFELLDRVYRTGEPFVGTDERIMVGRGPGRLPREYYRDFVYEPLRDADGSVSGILAHGVDVTGRWRAMEELRGARRRLAELSRRLIAAQEAERRHLARELHDVVGQELTALKLSLHATADDPDPASRAALARENAGAIDVMIGQVRDLAFALRPASLDDLGLVPALRSYAGRQGGRAGLEIGFTARAIPREIPPEVETACFRIAQEALTNVIRHAGARRVELALAMEADDLVLVVRDDGVGFDPDTGPERAARGEGLGLLGMRERAALLGGRLELEGVPGGGCTVRAVLPLSPARLPRRD